MTIRYDCKLLITIYIYFYASYDSVMNLSVTACTDLYMSYALNLPVTVDVIFHMS